MTRSTLVLGVLALLVAACNPDSDGDGIKASEDCNDEDATSYPGNPEVCDGVDNDCNGTVDDGVKTTFYTDADSDGYGDDTTGVEACDPQDDQVEDSTDCDDTRDDRHPGAVEDDCTDPTDYNCDGSVQYEDVDSDGFAACVDCNDTDGDINDDATELCDGFDNDCDGEVDEADAADASTWYADVDDDSFGDPASTIESCPSNLPDGYVADDTDCDDDDERVFPGAEEICDAKDTDCDGFVDEDLVPTDYATIQEAIEAGGSGTWVCVEPGTYVGQVDFAGIDAVVESAAGAESTILDGAGAGPVVAFQNAETSAAVLRGFTVTGGSWDQNGAGIYISGASPTLDDLIVTGNTSTGSLDGGAIAAFDSDFSLSSSLVFDNELIGGQFGGGGIGFFGGSPSLDHVDVVGNLLEDDTAWGGGLACYESNPVIRHLRLAANQASSGSQLTGSGAAFVYCEADITNLIVAGNHATGGAPDFGGALMFAYSSTGSVVTNASITGNTSDATEGRMGLVLFQDAVQLTNVDVSNNTATASGGTYYGSDGIACLFGAGSPTLSYTNAWGNTEGDGSEDCANASTWTGTLSTDPAYTDTTAADPSVWDLTPASGSGLIDAGDPSISDGDGSISDVGAMGGPDGGAW